MVVAGSSPPKHDRRCSGGSVVNEGSWGSGLEESFDCGRYITGQKRLGNNTGSNSEIVALTCLDLALGQISTFCH
jgi:hypothetical protein